MRFLLDENISGDTASFLRRAGHTVVRSAPKTSDPEVLARAEAEGALILTRDHDFLGFEPSAACGILYLHIHPSIAEDITQAVRNVVSRAVEASLYGHVTIVTRHGFDILPNPH